MRYEQGVGFNQPPLPRRDDMELIRFRAGRPTDGLVMVGVASPARLAGLAPACSRSSTNTTAFRYVHNAGLADGDDDGDSAAGDGRLEFPDRGVGGRQRDAGGGKQRDGAERRGVSLQRERGHDDGLGSPNTAWTPRLLGGMTADGVAAVTFASSPTAGPAPIAGLGLPPTGRYAYFHNSHGWFHLSSALASQGIDLQGALLGSDEPGDHGRSDGERRRPRLWTGQAPDVCE